MRRATSDLYYAMFHTLCETLAGLVDTSHPTAIGKEAWLGLYRMPDHKQAEKRCADGRINEFPDGIGNFARLFVTFKTKREDADYDGLARFAISQVRNDLIVVEACIADFHRVDPSLKQQFALFAALRPRCG